MYIQYYIYEVRNQLENKHKVKWENIKTTQDNII